MSSNPDDNGNHDDPRHIAELATKEIIRPLIDTCAAFINVSKVVENQLPTSEEKWCLKRNKRLPMNQIVAIRRLERRIQLEQAEIKESVASLDKMEEVIASLEDKAEQTDYEFEIFGKKLPELKELLMSTLSIELSPTVPSQRRWAKGVKPDSENPVITAPEAPPVAQLQPRSASAHNGIPPSSFAPNVSPLGNHSFSKLNTKVEGSIQKVLKLETPPFTSRIPAPGTVFSSVKKQRIFSDQKPLMQIIAATPSKIPRSPPPQSAGAGVFLSSALKFVRATPVRRQTPSSTTTSSRTSSSCRKPASTPRRENTDELDELTLLINRLKYRV